MNKIIKCLIIALLTIIIAKQFVGYKECGLHLSKFEVCGWYMKF